MRKGSSNLYAQIKIAVSSGKLKQPFTVADVNNACNGLLAKSPAFLSKHRLNNAGGIMFILENDENTFCFRN